MKIVIDILKEIYDSACSANNIWNMRMAGFVCEAIANGTPLPKGHGDLIDVNRKITVPIYDEQYEEWREETLTVREALNRWSDEGITVKDVVISADKTESEEQTREIIKKKNVNGWLTDGIRLLPCPVEIRMTSDDKEKSLSLAADGGIQIGIPLEQVRDIIVLAERESEEQA